MALVLLQSQVIGLFLPVRKHPLFHLFLVPVHLHFVLVHFLVALEDLVLQVVQALLDLNAPRSYHRIFNLLVI